ncbi:MAG: nitroreductase family deazaflavin-dependent oxidoreductase [Gammaproteobacteria bacterium]|jgi:deazaflavin-dependent oxidoreductase (nitroreductase family)|nr:nitroreductase family deazaflavin-dependent oxidoreductase [Gammaproteobacteria bacterium]
MKEEPGLGWNDLLALAAEVKSESGPGTTTWVPEGSTTAQVNERVMEALRENGGTIPGELGSIPCLILTTTGAKSGQLRSVPLFCQTVDGRLVIIGSMGGAPRNPPWYYNLLKDPKVSVEKDGKTFQAKAQVLTGAERDYFFRKFAEAYPIFAEYQAGTTRVIPIVELRPIS